MAVPLFFGRFLVDQQFITDEELATTLQIQLEINDAFIATVLECGLISMEQFRRIRNHQREKGMEFEEALRDLGLADKEEMQAIFECAREKSIRLGEIIVKRNILTQAQMNEALELFSSQMLKRNH